MSDFDFEEMEEEFGEDFCIEVAKGEGYEIRMLGEEDLNLVGHIDGHSFSVNIEIDRTCMFENEQDAKERIAEALNKDTFLPEDVLLKLEGIIIQIAKEQYGPF